jgi:hypothetical protein
VQLQEDANFCHKCGHTIKDTKKPVDDNVEWEYCQIELKYRDDPSYVRRTFPGFFNIHNVCWFFAEAVGADGKYNAGNSSEFTSGAKHTKKESETKHSQLIEKLLKEGWVPLPERGDAWWQWRFKRKLKS